MTSFHWAAGGACGGGGGGRAAASLNCSSRFRAIQSVWPAPSERRLVVKELGAVLACRVEEFDSEAESMMRVPPHAARLPVFWVLGAREHFAHFTSDNIVPASP